MKRIIPAVGFPKHWHPISSSPAASAIIAMTFPPTQSLTPSSPHFHMPHNSYPSPSIYRLSHMQGPKHLAYLCINTHTSIQLPPRPKTFHRTHIKQHSIISPLHHLYFSKVNYYLVYAYILIFNFITRPSPAQPPLTSLEKKDKKQRNGYNI